MEGRRGRRPSRDAPVLEDQMAIPSHRSNVRQHVLRAQRVVAKAIRRHGRNARNTLAQLQDADLIRHRRARRGASHEELGVHPDGVAAHVPPASTDSDSWAERSYSDVPRPGTHEEAHCVENEPAHLYPDSIPDHSLEFDLYADDGCEGVHDPGYRSRSGGRRGRGHGHGHGSGNGCRHSRRHKGERGAHRPLGHRHTRPYEWDEYDKEHYDRADYEAGMGSRNPHAPSGAPPRRALPPSPAWPGGRAAVDEACNAVARMLHLDEDSDQRNRSVTDVRSAGAGPSNATMSAHEAHEPGDRPLAVAATSIPSGDGKVSTPCEAPLAQRDSESPDGDTFSEPAASTLTPNPSSKGRLAQAMEAVDALVPPHKRLRWSDVEPFVTAGNVVGSGATGEVYSGTVRGDAVAIKVTRGRGHALRHVYDFAREARALCSLSEHRNVIPLHFVVAEPAALALVFPLAEKLEDACFMLESGSSEVLSYMLDIARGLRHLHSHGIEHRDLKPGNLLVLGEGDDRRAVVSDFGLAKLRFNISRTTSAAQNAQRGTVAYMAPEQAMSVTRRTFGLSPKTDIWAFGHIVNELVGSKLPYEEVGEDDIAHFVRSEVASGRFTPQPADSLPPALHSLTAQCFSYDPTARPSAHDAVVVLSDLIYGTDTELMT